MALAHLKVQESESHPRRFTMIDAIDQPQLGDIRKQFRLSDFSATRNDRIGEVLPHHRQEATDHAISLTVEDDRPPDMDHRIAATGQPIDVGHVVELDGHHWFASKRKSFWNVTFERLAFRQKAGAH
jgi:hypothetical protein